METLTTVLSAGLKTDFAPLKGAKFIGVENHNSRWGLLAIFDNNMGVFFMAGSPLAKYHFSNGNVGKMATGGNYNNLPELI